MSQSPRQRVGHADFRAGSTGTIETPVAASRQAPRQTAVPSMPKPRRPGWNPQPWLNGTVRSAKRRSAAL
jgi:hypothetical protein